MESRLVSSPLMLAQSPTRNSHCQFHKQPASQRHHHEASKPSRPIADLCSVTTRLHHKSRKVSRGIWARVFAGVGIAHANRPNRCTAPIQKPHNQMSPRIPIPQSINPGSGPRNPSEIHRPRLPVQLVSKAQETLTWMERPSEVLRENGWASQRRHGPAKDHGVAPENSSLLFHLGQPLLPLLIAPAAQIHARQPIHHGPEPDLPNAINPEMRTRNGFGRLQMDAACQDDQAGGEGDMGGIRQQAPGAARTTTRTALAMRRAVVSE